MTITSCKFNGDRSFSILLAIYLSLIPIETVLTFGVIGSFHKYIGILLVAYVFFKNVFSRNGLKIQLIEKSKLLFSVIAFFSILWSFDTSITISTSTTLLSFALFNLFLMQRSYTEDEYNLIKNFIIIVGVFIAVNIILRTSFTVIEYGRVTFGFDQFKRVDYNNLALGLAFSDILLLIDIKKYSHKHIYQILSLILCFIITFAIFMTGSRGGLLCFLVATFCYFLYLLRYQRLVYKIIVIIGFAVLIPIFSYYLFKYNTDVAMRFSMASIEESGGSGRLTIWLGAINAFFNENIFRQVFGIGYGTFPAYFRSLFGRYVATHNDYIQILLELGLFGFGILVSVFLSELIHYFKSKNITSLVLIILILVSCLTMETLFKKVTWAAFLLSYIARSMEYNKL